jgi:hypothetical protein
MAITERIAGMDIETGQLVVSGTNGRMYAIAKVLIDPFGDDCMIYNTCGKDRWIVTHGTVEIRS